ncbi:23S rRNA (uracil(1939)-C(5))-methyltransferase RlmD [Desulforamulus hydrothermalis]|uniref:Putative enzyme n=1 Tax=Desulforamulus hydrothermalis Lam5 = DSM 18033 TaxID=1121428 RepID=K8ELF2_9FIRM|nr:23S rRNA (uracil(1939)-C(5))-methyltransferase RlmD [Desulforamulus hydrothermalis]CCO09321.1 putative enzyme [Desulforamulus hydrothermalis Lam5 = DSM 18033]SHH04194.1 23S rRNA m(5)U-1939 methyltransferase [Desulforamulus hydrothermalis Lam5 = DSM 18033]
MAKHIEVGEILELTIHGLGHAGEGVGRHENLAVFVPDVLPGERVRISITQVKKTYARGKVKEILHPAPYRVVPQCPASHQCGGCQLQHLNYQAQLAQKREMVQAALTRLGGLGGVEVNPTLGMADPWHYRNKIHLQVMQEAGRVKLGFYAEGSYRLAAGPAQQACLLVDKQINQVAAVLEELVNQHRLPPYHWQKQTGLLRHVIFRRGFHTGEIMVVLVTSGAPWPAAGEFAKAVAARHPAVVSVIRNINNSPERVILGEKNLLLAGREYITDYLMGLQFKISATSFYQVNPRQTEVLYNKVLEFANLQGQETVVDAYCGIGTIANCLAPHARRVLGMEIVPSAVADAKANALANGLNNTEFKLGAVEKLLPQMVAGGLQPDLVVLDPPRKGCAGEVLEAVSRAGVPRVIYVSCDPATLARDLGILDNLGYRTLQVQPVDMFPWTSHVECVVLMSRVEK